MKEQQQLAIETAIMTEDVDNEINLRDVKFSGECVITEDSLVFYKTEITNEEDQVCFFWVALGAKGPTDLIFEDDQPEGIHIPAFGV